MLMYVAGEWRGATAEEEVRSPFDGEVVGSVPVAGAEDAERAITAAVDGARAMRALTAYALFPFTDHVETLAHFTC